MSSNFKIVIVEDEPIIARELAQLLLRINPAITIVKTLGTVTESVEWFAQNPDACQLVFMDINLGDGYSFEIFKHVAIERPVIFVTSFEEYALEAFRNNGLHYILKPFDETGLREALDKYHKWIEKPQASLPPDIGSLFNSIQKLGRSYRKSFLVHVKNKLIPVPTGDIAWFYTANEIVYACTVNGRNLIVDETMEQLVKQLDPECFFRANRQLIVQRKAVADIDFFFNGRLQLNVKPEAPERIIVSRARAVDFRNWLNN